MAPMLPCWLIAASVGQSGLSLIPIVIANFRNSQLEGMPFGESGSNGSFLWEHGVEILYKINGYSQGNIISVKVVAHVYFIELLEGKLNRLINQVSKISAGEYISFSKKLNTYVKIVLDSKNIAVILF